MSLEIFLAHSLSMPWTTWPTTRTESPDAETGLSQLTLLRSTPRLTSLPLRMSMTCLETNSEGAATVIVASGLDSSTLEPEPLRS